MRYTVNAHLQLSPYWPWGCLHEIDQFSASNQELMVMMMLIMSVIVAIRTGRQTPLSAPRLTWVPAAGLAQNHSSPEIAR